MKNFYLMIFLLFKIFCNVSLAQIQETKLVPIDGQLNDVFGYSVASDGNYLVVGAAFSHYDHPGYASLYEKIDEVWTEKSKLQASDGYPAQGFGRSVSISGDFILIGACYDNQIGPNAGAAYVFKRDTVNGNWIEMQKLFASDSLDYALFGYSVALFGDRAVIGAPRYVDSVETGAAYIFKWNGTVWVEEAKLVPVNGVGIAQEFGSSVSIFGDYAVIGAYGDEELEGWPPGAAYIFYNNGSHWIQQAKLHASDINLNHYFGWSVSIYEDYAAVGSKNALTTTGGAALIFHRNDTTWTGEAILEGSSSFSPIDFGYSVSLDGDYLIVGAPDERTNGNDGGCAYIFKRNGKNWTEQAKLLASDGTEDDWMGWSVFIEDDEVFVGAPVQDAGDKYCGAVYVYTGFITGVKEIKHNFVKDFCLKQNYPNPFNSSTEIQFAVREGGYVELKICDLLGRKVKMLVNERKAPGSYTLQWDGTDETGQPVASGVYLYLIQAGKFSEVRKMLLV